MADKKFPKKVVSLLADNGIEEKDILAYSQSDMNVECEYADGYAVLTATKLAVLISAADMMRVRLFKGYTTKNTVPAEGENWAVRMYEVSDIDELKVEPLVACSILIAKTKDGDLRLTAFSNLNRAAMNKLSRKFKDIKKAEPGSEILPDEEDLNEEYCPNCGSMYPDKNRKICPKCMDRKSIFIRMLGYFKPYRGRIAVMIMCYILVAALNMVWPYLNGTVFYDYVLAKDADFLAKLGIEDGRFVTALLMVVLTMLATRITLLLLQVLQAVITAKIVTSVVCDIKKSIFSTMGKLSISFFRSKKTGHLMTRTLSDAERVTGFFIDEMPYIFIHSLTMIATVAVMAKIKWQMAVVSIVLIPVSMVLGYYMRPRIWSRFGHRHRAEKSVNSQVNDNLTGARVVKAFGQEKRELERFEHNNVRLRDAEMSIISMQNFFKITFSSAYQIMNIAVWILGVYYIMVKHNLELGVLITFTGYVGQLQGPINFLSYVFHGWADSMNSAQRIFEILDAVPEIREAENPVKMPKPDGRIELKNVSFGYEANRQILKDVSLEIPAGMLLGIVGRSGAGKTTLVNLISRMYDVNEGEILIDGVNVKDIAFHDLRRNVAMVSQETYIFMGSVADNIAYANPDASRADIIRAAKLASAHEFIMRMPDGYDTIIGSAGRELSGGEKQRISIARAILADPKILILDEATASVDTETERAIQSSISYLIKGRTTISIAHRLSTLKDADFLVVLDEGRITERGTAAELEELHGTYYKLMELQTKALAMKGIE